MLGIGRPSHIGQVDREKLVRAEFPARERTNDAVVCADLVGRAGLRECYQSCGKIFEQLAVNIGQTTKLPNWQSMPYYQTVNNSRNRAQSLASRTPHPAPHRLGKD